MVDSIVNDELEASITKLVGTKLAPVGPTKVNIQKDYADPTTPNQSSSDYYSQYILQRARAINTSKDSEKIITEDDVIRDFVYKKLVETMLQETNGDYTEVYKAYKNTTGGKEVSSISMVRRWNSAVGYLFTVNVYKGKDNNGNEVDVLIPDEVENGLVLSDLERKWRTQDRGFDEVEISQTGTIKPKHYLEVADDSFDSNLSFKERIAKIFSKAISQDSPIYKYALTNFPDLIKSVFSEAKDLAKPPVDNTKESDKVFQKVAEDGRFSVRNYRRMRAIQAIVTIGLSDLLTGKDITEYALNYIINYANKELTFLPKDAIPTIDNSIQGIGFSLLANVVILGVMGEIVRGIFIIRQRQIKKKSVNEMLYDEMTGEDIFSHKEKIRDIIRKRFAKRQ